MFLDFQFYLLQVMKLVEGLKDKNSKVELASLCTILTKEEEKVDRKLTKMSDTVSLRMNRS